ncbi:MAG TPA: hypothetical protein PLB89_00730 [Flavobacteriales bacterium]|nr:hypothetical protein [Flavobacteriales bacterium]
MRTLFWSDLRKEKLLATYLDRCYRRNGIQIKRYNDAESQRNGLDVRLEKDGKTFIVDEKAQLHYLNKSLPTFSLELSLMTNGTERPGWFFDPAKRTEVYSFVFDIHLTNGVERLERHEDIASANIVLVNRARLKNTLAEAGLTEILLRRMCNELRNSGDDRRSVRSPGVRVMLSKDLAEQPVNLLVLRRHLEEIGQVLAPC